MKLWLSIALGSAAVCIAGTAAAETGRYNLHVAGGVAAPEYGGAGEVGFDFQVAPPVALEWAVGGGYLHFDQDDTPLITTAMGVRFRFADDQSGYIGEGSAAGHFWVGPRIGAAYAAGGPAGTLDVGVGYSWSVVSPMSLGLCVRPAAGIAEAGPVFMLTGGLEASFEFDPIRDPIPPPPAPPPPRPAPPPEPEDDDGDGVFNPHDECPGTPAGQKVDELGCAIVVLDGIVFDFDSAGIKPSSTVPLKDAARLLSDNPEVRVEISGHTDDQGTDEYNKNLSLQRANAVKRWLVDHGVDASRMTTRGYGNTEPLAGNDDEEGRAKNRRIEFRQLGR